MDKYWLSRPEFDFLPHQTALESCLAQGLATGTILQTPIPKWAFLMWLTGEKNLLAHGTGDPSIAVFEPRQADDAGAFGNQNAVYAASDAMWATFFAILDRQNTPMSIINTAMRASQQPPRDIYFFSVCDQALAKRPFRFGWVYFFERGQFVQEPAYTMRELTVQTHHWASLEAVRPLLKVFVEPQDFVFLQHIRSHNEAEVWQRVKKNPNGFPWVEV
jgi:hypothetical protein